MKNQEAKSAVVLRHWLKANPISTCAIETKDTRGKDYLMFGEVSDAQLVYGRAIKSDRGVLLRVQAVSEGMPDYIYMRNEPSWIVIKYPNCFEIIDVDTFILEKTRSKRKSLTSVRAREISVKTISLRSNRDR